MISLAHLNACKQIISLGELDLSGKRRFITDTRQFKAGDAFIAIPGQKVNPLNLVGNLLASGCDLIFYQHNDENEGIVKNLKNDFSKADFVAVRDSVFFIQELAHQHIKEWLKNPSHTLFAISGSNGKTTHKEMLSHIMENILPGQVVSTRKNNNNHLGVPLTLFNVNEQTKFIVLELGSNHPGEIKFLCDLALPNAGLTTNIGATHLEFFGTEEAVFHEEAYLYYAVKENTHGEGFFLINNDDLFLKSLKDTEGSVRFGSSNSPVQMTYFVDGAKLGDVEVHNPNITGNHNKSNLATCAYIACRFYPELKNKIVEAASTFKPTPNRSQWIEVGTAKVFLDAYNANPSSMKVALQGFRDQVLTQGYDPRECCVVLGDMNELGPKSAEYHVEVGEFVASLGFQNLIFIGRFAENYIQGAKKGSAFASAADFKKNYQEKYLGIGGYHFIKGSRSLQLESLFDIT